MSKLAGKAMKGVGQKVWGDANDKITNSVDKPNQAIINNQIAVLQNVNAANNSNILAARQSRRDAVTQGLAQNVHSDYNRKMAFIQNAKAEFQANVSKGDMLTKLSFAQGMQRGEDLTRQGFANVDSVDWADPSTWSRADKALFTGKASRGDLDSFYELKERYGQKGNPQFNNNLVEMSSLFGDVVDTTIGALEPGKFTFVSSKLDKFSKRIGNSQFVRTVGSNIDDYNRFVDNAKRSSVGDTITDANGALRVVGDSKTRTGAFDPSNVKVWPDLGKLDGREVKISQKGLNMVENHLKHFEGDGPILENNLMLNRLRDSLNEGKTLSGADASFYIHEVTEAAKTTKITKELGIPYKSVGDQDYYDLYQEVHWGSINKYEVSPYSVYHPDVIKQVNIQTKSEYPTFDNRWTDFWNNLND